MTSDLANERGIYQIIATRKDKPDKVFYGKFHAFLRRVEGHWRIAVDYDSNEGGTLTAVTFAAGAEIDDVARFAG